MTLRVELPAPGRNPRARARCYLSGSTQSASAAQDIDRADSHPSAANHRATTQGRPYDAPQFRR
jgi:hypothetical protein